MAILEVVHFLMGHYGVESLSQKLQAVDMAGTL